MRISIHATRVLHTNAIDAYVTKRLAALDRILDPEEASALVAVEVGKEAGRRGAKGDLYFAEATMRLKKKEFYAREVKDDLYAAIDALRAEIVREVKKHHARAEDRARDGHRAGKDMARNG